MHYAWVMAAVTFIILLGASGFRSAPSVLIVPLQEEFGWSRATISIAISINLILFGFMGPFAAAMMERFGIRTVVTGALLVIAAGAALTTQMSAPWQLYLLWGVTVGLGTGSMATVLAATVATRWFVKRRGTGGRRTRRRQRNGAARLPAALRVACDQLWLAHGFDHRHDRHAIGHSDRAYFPARPSRQCGLAALRRGFARRSSRTARQPGSNRAQCLLGCLAFTHVLAAGRHLFHLRRHHQWPDRHPPDSGRHGPRHDRKSRPPTCWR